MHFQLMVVIVSGRIGIHVQSIVVVVPRREPEIVIVQHQLMEGKTVRVAVLKYENVTF